MTTDPLQSITLRALLKVFVSADQSEGTGKTVAVTISKNGAAFANPSAGATNATEVGSGWYYVDLSTTDLGTLGPLVVRGTATLCDPAERSYTVVAAANRGMTSLDATVSSRSTYAGGAVASVTGNVGGSVASIVGITAANVENMASRWLGMVVLDVSLYRFTAAALALAPSGGLTQQQVADALKLAPTAGSPAAGSVMATLAALSAGSGTGAFPITVTVTDGVHPIESAYVRAIIGVTPYTAITNASGNATFALDAGTYTVAVTASGYQFTPATRTVTGSQAGTLTSPLVMTATVIPAPPVNPDFCTVYGYVETPAGAPKVGASIAFTLKFGVAPNTGLITTYDTLNAVTDADGLFSLELRKGTYRAVSTPIGLDADITFSAATFNLSLVI